MQSHVAQLVLNTESVGCIVADVEGSLAGARLVRWMRCRIVAADGAVQDGGGKTMKVMVLVKHYLIKDMK